MYFDKDSVFKFIGSTLENFNFKAIHGINSALEISNSIIWHGIITDNNTNLMFV